MMYWVSSCTRVVIVLGKWWIVGIWWKIGFRLVVVTAVGSSVLSCFLSASGLTNVFIIVICWLSANLISSVNGLFVISAFVLLELVKCRWLVI